VGVRDQTDHLSSFSASIPSGGKPVALTSELILSIQQRDFAVLRVGFAKFQALMAEIDAVLKQLSQEPWCGTYFTSCLCTDELDTVKTLVASLRNDQHARADGVAQRIQRMAQVMESGTREEKEDAAVPSVVKSLGLEEWYTSLNEALVGAFACLQILRFASGRTDRCLPPLPTSVMERPETLDLLRPQLATFFAVDGTLAAGFSDSEGRLCCCSDSLQAMRSSGEGGLFGVHLQVLREVDPKDSAGSSETEAAAGAQGEEQSAQPSSSGDLRAHMRKLVSERDECERTLNTTRASLATMQSKAVELQSTLSVFSEEELEALGKIAQQRSALYLKALQVTQLEAELAVLTKEQTELNRQVKSFTVASDSILAENMESYREMEVHEARAAKSQGELNQMLSALKSLSDAENLELYDAEPDSVIGRSKAMRAKHKQAVEAVGALQQKVNHWHEDLENQDPGPMLLEKATELRKRNTVLQDEFKELRKLTFDNASLAHRARVAVIADERERLEQEILELEIKLGKKRKPVLTAATSMANAMKAAGFDGFDDLVDKDDEEQMLERRMLQYSKQVVWWEKRWSVHMSRVSKALGSQGKVDDEDETENVQKVMLDSIII
jgi:hypothetical protein